MARKSEPQTPVLDTLAAMTADSIERCGLSPRELMMVRLGALVAVDARPISYLLQLGPSADAGLTIEEMQDVLVGVAPVVGTPKVMAAAANIFEAVGVAIAVAEDQERASG